VFSGFAGLLYETVWLRQFATVFGTSEAALGAVLAGYMGGLALGAAAAARWSRLVKRPVLVYGLLELGVASGALLIPFGLQAAEAIRVWLCGNQSLPPHAGGFLEVILDTGLTFVLMLLPTSCMGATLPLLAGTLTTENETQGGRVARLYSLNTCGAVLGTLTTAFVCLPQLGLWGTVLVGVGINVVIFVLAALIQAKASIKEVSERHEFDNSDRVVQRTLNATLSQSTGFMLALLVATSSLIAFAYEIAWTRLLAHVLGGSVFAFATMLSAFLVGITLGSLWVSKALQRGQSAPRLLVVAQCLTAVGTAAAFAGSGFLPFVSRWFDASSFWAGGLVSLMVLLPSTLGIGMTLPLAIEWGGADAARTGRLFAASTLGAIAGSLLATHALLPLLGFQGLFGGGIAVNLLLAALVARAQRDSTAPSLQRGRDWRPAMGVTTCVFFVAIANTDSVLRSSPLLREPLPGQTIFTAVGTSSTVSLIEHAGEYRLTTNGLPESVIAPRGAVAGAESGLRWLTALPVLARPNAKSVLIVGLGGGGAVSGVPASVDEIHAIELEPQVVSAIRSIGSRRMHDPLSDPRLKLIHNDARAALALTKRRYDIIVSQPSHPWTAGASHIYTREFVQLARSRLTDDGVFLQWMDATFLDQPLLRTIGATLQESFEHTRLYQPHPGTLLFLASRTPLDVEQQLLTTGQPLRSQPPQFGWLGINDVADVAAALTLDHSGLQQFCAGASINTDNHNLLALRSLARQVKTDGDRISALEPDAFAKFDPLVDREIGRSLLTTLHIDASGVVRRLARTRFIDRATRIANSIPNPVEQSRARGMLALAQGESLAAREHFVDVVLARPNDRTARFKLLEPMLQLAGSPRAPHEFVQLVSTSNSIELAVVEAAKKYAQRDYSGLKSLDGQLSLARPHDACFPQALLFRGLWRAKVTNAERKHELAIEAIDFADRALAIEPSLFGALVRLWAAQNGDQAGHYVESAAFVINILNRDPSAMSASNAGQLAKQVLSRLRQLEEQSDISSPRLAEVRHLYEVITTKAQNEQPEAVDQVSR